MQKDLEINPMKNLFKQRKSRMPEENVFFGNLGKDIDNKPTPPIKVKRNEKGKGIGIGKGNISSLKADGNQTRTSMRTINYNRLNILDSKKKVQNTNINNAILNNNNNSNNILKYKKYMKLTDYELNILTYKDALVIDKRPYIVYYLSLIRTRHVIIFAFFSYNDYNSLFIKICFFFFDFTLYFTTNALFFNSSTLDRISDDGGSFNIAYQIPQIVYSSLISSIVNAIIKTICLTEKNIIEIKQDPMIKNLKQKGLNTLQWIFMKSICFFVTTFVLLLFFWYYLSCFCAVYKNTQIHLVKDTLISYGLSMIYPFLIYLIPGIFRIPALRAKNKNKETLYKFSKILQLI